MADHSSVDRVALLPDTCWHSSRTGKPWPMVRRDGAVIHKISGIYKFPDDPFDLDQIIEKLLVYYRSSYSVIITRHPVEVIRFVPDGIQAFHAGRSRFDGENYCNRFMDGVALVSTGKQYRDESVLRAHHGDEPAFLDEQIERLIEHLVAEMRRHGYGQDRITSHQNVRAIWNATYPQKKAQSRFGDPGDLPWNDVRAEIGRRVKDEPGS